MKSSGEISLREMVKDIAAGSTVSTADTIAVIEGLLQETPRYLAEGKIVRLGELGWTPRIPGLGVAPVAPERVSLNGQIRHLSSFSGKDELVEQRQRRSF